MTVLTIIKEALNTTVGRYAVLALLLLIAFGGWRGYACATQSIITPEEPDEVPDAIVPNSADYDRLKLPE